MPATLSLLSSRLSAFGEAAVSPVQTGVGVCVCVCVWGGGGGGEEASQLEKITLHETSLQSLPYTSTHLYDHLAAIGRSPGCNCGRTLLGHPHGSCEKPRILHHHGLQFHSQAPPRFSSLDSTDNLGGGLGMGD